MLSSKHDSERSDSAAIDQTALGQNHTGICLNFLTLNFFSQRPYSSFLGEKWRFSFPRSLPENSAARNVLADDLSGASFVLLTWVCQIWQRREAERARVVKSQAITSTVENQRSIRMLKHRISTN